MTFPKSLASIGKIRFPGSPRSKLDRKIRMGAVASLTILGGTAGYWAFKAITRSRNRNRTEGADTGRTELPSADSQMRAAELGKRWHSLDQERSKGQVPRDLSREPKDMDQRIHTEPTAEEASYLD